MRKRLIKLTRPAGPAIGLWEIAEPVVALPPILLVHGATFGAAIFDLDRTGYSLMAYLASNGRQVYALDIRGYGSSMDTDVMNAPAALHPPFAPAKEALDDIGLAVSFICEQTHVDRIDLVGFSWGTITSSLFATSFPNAVRKLALYAPLFGEHNDLWRRRIGDAKDPARLASRYGAYRRISLGDIVARWNDDLPEANVQAFREEGVAELLFNSQAALDPGAAGSEPKSFRCPNGALADLIQIFNGHPLYDPARLTMPVLLVRGEYDTTSTRTDAKSLYSQLDHPQARYCEIPGGSHFLCVERNRHSLYEEIRGFLET